jgi:non-ribosomal peptide synthetase component F
MFVNMIVVRVNAAGDPSFAELLDRVRQALLEAWDHQEMPFQKLVEVLPQHRDAGLPPLYQLGFNYLSIGFSRASAAAEDDLMLEISRGHGRLEYNTALFTEQTARRIADGYQRVLSAVTAAPGIRMSELPVAVLVQQAPEQEDQPAARAPHVAPRTAAEELVAGAWSEVLGMDQVGALDDFFDLGGHSLLALRVIARLSAAIDAELTIQSFFADTTVAGVAAELERLLTAELAEMPDDEAARLAAGEV